MLLVIKKCYYCVHDGCVNDSLYGFYSTSDIIGQSYPVIISLWPEHLNKIMLPVMVVSCLEVVT